jgi:hypothetical protein
MGKPYGKTVLGRPRRKWEDRRDRMRRRGLDCSGTGWGLLGGCCEYGDEPSGSIKCWEALD